MYHQLSIVAIIKGEPDLEEWIEYHRMLGVEHFYLFDNSESGDALYNVWPDEVTVIVWPGKVQQLPAYDHFLKTYAGETEWAAFIDADEYLVPREGSDLRELLLFYGDGGLAVNWRVFGSAGYDLRPQGLVIENYQRCGVIVFDQNRMIKTIVRPRTVESITSSPHCFRLKEGFRVLNTAGESVAWASTSVPNFETIQLNHYCTKSKEDFIDKIKRGRADLDADPRDWAYFEYFDRNERSDRTIQRFVPELKKRMGL